MCSHDVVDQLGQLELDRTDELDGVLVHLGAILTTGEEVPVALLQELGLLILRVIGKDAEPASDQALAVLDKAGRRAETEQDRALVDVSDGKVSGIHDTDLLSAIRYPL